MLKIRDGRKTCLFNDDVICKYYTLFMVDELNVIMEILTIDQLNAQILVL